MEKYDLMKELGALYRPPKEKPVLVQVPRMNYVMVDGKGDPNTSIDYRDSIQAIFTVSYTLKFMVKKGPRPVDYRVMPLEGLWWADSLSSFAQVSKEEWKWTSMMVQPGFVTADMVKAAVDKARGKGLPALEKVRFEAYDEGLSAQILHIGPFSEEGPTIERLHEFIEQGNHSMRGKHHEIYMSDVRRVDPQRMKTIIRQPVG